ncbi:DNA-directed RNA polymerase sigma-70 factor [Amycolatopsis acidiphila]|nr:DNA-directed RNA polymerase sigma-70 factor [Amycolatopsis acidiphila]
MVAPRERNEQSAWALVRAAQAGDTVAFGEIYRRYFPVVEAYLFRRTADRVLAEDLTSETFLRAFDKIGSVSDLGKDVQAWLFTIARNLLFDFLRSGRHRREIVWADYFECADESRGLDHALLCRVVGDELARCVDQLNDEQRECIVLRFYEELSVSEVAARMCRREGTVRALQYRAVRKLAQLVSDWVR